MGTFIGHVLSGIGFYLLGLWHLFNNTKLHFQNKTSFTTTAWFPTSRLRYLELILITIGSSITVSMELFIGPRKHQPFDADGTIPSNHLHNFEHSSISMCFATYGILAILLDKSVQGSSVGDNNIAHRKNSHLHDHVRGLTLLVASMCFGLELFNFHFHSTDHMAVEGQYHLLIQIVAVVSFATTLISVGLPGSFLVSYVRSVSIMCQGGWFIVMGYMLWTPELVPKGCMIHREDGHEILRCSGEESLERAKSLVNIFFSWFLIGFIIGAILFYVSMVRIYSAKYYNNEIANGASATYCCLPTKQEGCDEFEGEPLEHHIEMQKKTRSVGK
ncbi:unnamed protein product [Linum tenue]|uniref:Uncharacterized protein n=1 Tax=Linum tenue TaxID=586396 RepID=A0AAV0M1K8_9ROSI|nr:unnamed protein product [Linum tenue]